MATTEIPTLEGDIRAVLTYVSRGRRYVDSEPYPDARARRALGEMDMLATLAPEPPSDSILAAVADLAEIAVQLVGTDERQAGRILDVATRLRRAAEPGE